MTKHTLNIDNLRSESFKHLLASSAGKGSCKHLNVCVNLANGTVAYEVNDAKTDDLERAVWLYNALP